MSQAAAQKRKIEQVRYKEGGINDTSMVIDGGFEKKRPLLGYDWPLIGGLVLILVFGLIMLYSASSYTSYVSFGYSYFYVRKQLIATLAGLVLMVIVSFFPMKFWKAVSVPAVAAAVVLVLLVKTSLGVESNGARRWLEIAGVSIQPSEVLKFAFVIGMALLITLTYKNLNRPKTFFAVFIAGIIPAGLVIIVTDDLGTGMVFVGMLFVILCIACGLNKYLIISFAAAFAAAIYFIVSEPYRLLRIKAWLNIEDYADSSGYQIMQGLYAIGSGGFFGKGIGKSTQKLTFVPEAENDMIFSIICEELGILGAIILCLLYALIIWRIFKIFLRTEDLYCRLVVAGVASHIGIQALINMCVVTNLLPNTGVPLPFISYGGTSSLILLAEAGLVLAVSRGSYPAKKRKRQ